MKPALLRRALHAAVDAFFDIVEPVATSEPKRAYVRPVARPDVEPDELARELARNELRRKGVL